jgi:hypothetical protein
MIVREKKKVTVTQTKYLHTVCDKCDNVIQHYGSFDQFDCTLTLKTGEMFPEGGSIEIKEIHLCQSCANELFTRLKSEGYNINYSEI